MAARGFKYLKSSFLEQRLSASQIDDTPSCGQKFLQKRLWLNFSQGCIKTIRYRNQRCHRHRLSCSASQEMSSFWVLLLRCELDCKCIFAIRFCCNLTNSEGKTVVKEICALPVLIDLLLCISPTTAKHTDLKTNTKAHLDTTVRRDLHEGPREEFPLCLSVSCGDRWAFSVILANRSLYSYDISNRELPLGTND